MSRADRSVRRWVALYTRGLPAEVARARRDEMASDLHEHRAAARAAGLTARQVDRFIAGRAIGGVGSDLSWREGELRRAHAARMLRLPVRRRRAIGRAVAGAYVLGALLTGLGVLAVVRLLTPGGTGVLVPSIREGILAATVACAVSLVFVARPTSRGVGMLGLALAALPLSAGVMQGMPGISARGDYLLYRLSAHWEGEFAYRVIQLGPGLAVAALLVGGALWLRRAGA